MADALKVGERVRFKIAAREVLAIVVEDLGNIGVEGRQLVIVETETEADVEPERFSMPAADLERIGRRRRGPRRAPTASK